MAAEAEAAATRVKKSRYIVGYMVKYIVYIIIYNINHIQSLLVKYSFWVAKYMTIHGKLFIKLCIFFKLDLNLHGPSEPS